MKPLSRVLAVLAVSCIATQASANTQITCQGTGANSTYQLMFTTSANPSGRTVGALNLTTPSAGALVIAGVRVAQYLNNPLLIYILTDDVNQNLWFAFSGTPGLREKDGSYPATLTQYTNNQPSSLITLKCTAATI